jgi:hypothetical protein
MFESIHRKLGTAGFIISIVALVAALGGGAYAASGGLTGKQKKEVEKISKKYAGKPGPIGTTGPAGSTGPVGTKGDTGTAGTNGTNGTNGSPGAPGLTGFTEHLPSGKTETGTWAAGPYGAGVAVTMVPISFPIPILGPTAVYFIPTAGPTTPKAEEECAGTHEQPTAEPGALCVYQTSGFGFTYENERNPQTGEETEGAGEVGALLVFELASASASARGVWAATAL